MDGAKIIAYLEHALMTAESKAFQEDMSDVFHTVVGETRPGATKLVVHLAKTLWTWCTGAFAKFNGNRCIRRTKTCECQTMTRGHAVV